MNISLLPFNIALLILKDEDIKTMRPTKVLDIFSPSSRQFHPDGLFSTETYGKFGEERRNRLFSYIKLHTEILHPIVYKAIIDLKSLYGDILAGKTYAVFNPVTKDFEESNISDGDTGFNFFMSNLKELTFEEKPSIKREFNIRLINKYRDTLTLSNFLVMPAGLRDYNIDENGKPSEDEINSLYRKVLSLAGIIENVNVKINLEYIDATRYSLQLAVYDIYLYIKAMLEGKKKFVQSKVVSRKIYHSTRNVITSHIPENKKLFGPKSVSSTQTVIGLYQFLRATLPLSVKNIRDGFLSDVFIGPNSPAILVNKKTLKKETVDVDSSNYDKWMTFEGLEKVMVEFGQEALRHNYVTVDDYYLGLIYLGKDNTYKIIQDIDDVPEYLVDQGDVRPISFMELLYLSVYKGSSKIPNLITRYPITGYGSIYPSYTYLRTTVKSEVRTERGNDWEPTINVAEEFPMLGLQSFNSMCVSSTNVGKLGADKIFVIK